VYLELSCCLKIVKVGVCVKLIRLASPHKTHPSCPDLIRASITVTTFFEGRWITGSSPVTTISVGMMVFAPRNDEKFVAPFG
jgi:hypothetical protein